MIRRIAMEQFKNFLIKYRGAIIGGIVAIIALILKIYKILLGGLVIVAGIFLGNYIQQNKEIVKEKIKNIIERW
jgi:uncharacterized membrane protein